MVVDCLHPLMLLHLGSPVLSCAVHLGAGLAVAWCLLYIDPRGYRLVLMFVEGRGDSLTARLCLVAMKCALASCLLRWTLCSWLGTVPWLGLVAPLHLAGERLLRSRRCRSCGFLERLTIEL